MLTDLNFCVYAHILMYIDQKISLRDWINVWNTRFQVVLQ